MNNLNSTYISSRTFPEIFYDSVNKYADNNCQCWKSEMGEIESLTYKETGKIVTEMAAGLIAMEIKKQDRIAIMSYNCPQWLWADFSILNAGGITVSIYPTFSQREMAFIINDSSSKMLCIQDEATLQKVINIWDAMPSLKKIIILKEHCSSKHPDVIDINRLREIGKKYLKKNTSDYEKRWQSINIQDRMTIIYTSGTTGRQKGSVHTHLSMGAANNLDFKIIPPISGDDVLLSILPLSHSYERQFGQMMSIVAGGTIAYAEKSWSILKNMQFFQPTWFAAAPSIYENIFMEVKKHFAVNDRSEEFERNLSLALQILEERADSDGFIDASEGIDIKLGWSDDLKLKYLEAERTVFKDIRDLLGGRYRFSISAAGALSADLCEIFLAVKLPVIEGYGLVETCNTVNLNRIDKILPGSVGPLAPEVEGIIAEDGEWLVRGDNIIHGYWNDIESTLEAFTEDGFFKTGDIVEELADGYIKLLDRKKDILVLTSGNKVPAIKIEKLFSLNRYIDQICVIGDDREYVVALVVPNFNFFINYFQEKNIRFKSSELQYLDEKDISTCIKVGPDFIEKKEIQDLIAKEISIVNKKLEDYETIKKYLIINRKFNITADEMTPTLKLKRKTIYKHFAVEIDKIYQEY